MWNSALTAYLHYLSFMVAFAALVVEHQLFSAEITLKQAWRLVITDSLYGLAAVTVLVTGILRVMYFGQGADYYLHNPVFHAKVGLFIGVGLLSLYPTISVLTWIGGLRKAEPPTLTTAQGQRFVWIVRGELLGLALIPLLAAMLARGLLA
ncbi:membrane protein [Leptolyngbya sp. BL0902]|uniref:DUF2214 family protein n=1 Tax=Leptolyngbya sp. BL0902 TaxID=1115757 RepID=UPI0018E874F6|nr:DUF2214 family protein [Leptolyngbya sp. BL0902]QQE64990.1 membrane protein [Leptolyngbya sp. BL0902]